jgi:hypothetical protein
VRLIDQFCAAYAEWDDRSNVGDVYLTPIMQYLGGHVRRGNDPHELGEYEIDDVREELMHLTRDLLMDAAFLVASLIRAIDVELVETSESYGKKLESLSQKRAVMEQLFEQHGATVPKQALESMRSTFDSVWALHDHSTTEPRPDQQRIIDWRELMGPIIDRQNLEQAHREQWGDPD